MASKPKFAFKSFVIGRIAYSVHTVPNLTLPDKKTKAQAFTDYLNCAIYIEANLPEHMQLIFFWQQVYQIMLSQAGRVLDASMDSIVTQLSYGMYQLLEDNDVDQ